MKVRRIGRTFRALLSAFVKASEGNHIVYECSSWDSARWTYEKGLRIVNEFMKPETDMYMRIRVGEGMVKFSGPLSDEERHKLNRNGRSVLIQDIDWTRSSHVQKIITNRLH